MTTIDKPIPTDNYVKYYNSEDETNCYDPPKRSKCNRPRKMKKVRRNEQERPRGNKDETYGGLDGSSHTSCSTESFE